MYYLCSIFRKDMASFKEYIPFYKRNLKVALPIMFAQLGGAVVQFADVKMVGALGTVELAAVALLHWLHP